MFYVVIRGWIIVLNTRRFLTRRWRKTSSSSVPPSRHHQVYAKSTHVYTLKIYMCLNFIHCSIHPSLSLPFQFYFLSFSLCLSSPDSIFLSSLSIIGLILFLGAPISHHHSNPGFQVSPVRGNVGCCNWGTIPAALAHDPSSCSRPLLSLKDINCANAGLYLAKDACILKRTEDAYLKLSLIG